MTSIIHPPTSLPLWRFARHAHPKKASTLILYHCVWDVPSRENPTKLNRYAFLRSMKKVYSSIGSAFPPFDPDSMVARLSFLVESGAYTYGTNSSGIERGRL